MSNATTLKKVRNEISGTVFSLPYYVAREKGYFADEGLDVEFVLKNGFKKPVSEAALIQDHQLVSSFGALSPFEQSETLDCCCRKAWV